MSASPGLCASAPVTIASSATVPNAVPQRSKPCGRRMAADQLGEHGELAAGDLDVRALRRRPSGPGRCAPGRRVGLLDGEVVDHRDRLGADADDVVDVHRDAVDADGLEAVGLLGERRASSRRRRWTARCRGSARRAARWRSARTAAREASAGRARSSSARRPGRRRPRRPGRCRRRRRRRRHSSASDGPRCGRRAAGVARNGGHASTWRQPDEARGSCRRRVVVEVLPHESEHAEVPAPGGPRRGDGRRFISRRREW